MEQITLWQGILIVIYLVSAFIAFNQMIKKAKISEVAKMIGKQDYIATGTLISLVPIVNTTMAIMHIIEKIKMKKNV